MYFILPTIHYCIILMLCGYARFPTASIKMAERKKQNKKQSRNKVAIEGGHLSVEQKILLCGVTVN